MALSKDTPRKARGNRTTHQYAIKTAATVYVGSLVAALNASNRIEGAKGTSRGIAGVVISLDKSGANGAGSGVGNTAGTELATVAYGDEHEMTIKTTIRTNAALGFNVWMDDDDVVAGTAVGTAGVRVIAGELTAFSASDKSKGWVKIRSYATRGNITF